MQKIVDAPLMLSIRMWLLPCHGLFCLETLPICWLWIPASKSHSNEVAYKSKYHLHSIDAYFGTGAITALFSLSAINAANTLVMHNCVQIASQLTFTPNKKSLSLHWLSFSALGCIPVALSFAYLGCQYVCYEQQHATCFPINVLTRPKIVDPPFTLTLNMS